MIVQKNQIFQRKRWMTLITKAFALILGITLTLPTFAATAAPSPIEGVWKLVNPPQYGPFVLYLNNDGRDGGSMVCNTYSGSYQTIDTPYPGGPIRFGPQASTYASCGAADKIEEKYLQQLQSSDFYEVHEDTLVLYGRDGVLEYAGKW